MKHLIAAAGLCAVTACPYLNAQSLCARANVPFNFQMGEALMPAGKYKIQESGDLLIVRAENGKRTAVSLTMPTSRSAVSNNPKLEFNRYGDDYFLATIWNPTSHDGRALLKTAREKELASQHRTIRLSYVAFEDKAR